MKSLNQKATAIFRRIIDGLHRIGDSKTIRNNPNFMALHVEIIGRHGSAKIVSLAHYFEQSGDLMRDPDVEFLVTDTEVLPLTYQQDGMGIYQRGAWIDNGKVHADIRLQAQISEFCDMWMSNLAEQQHV